MAAVAGVDVGGGLPRDPQGDIPEEQQPTQRQWNFQKRKGRKRKGPVIARRRKKSVFDYDSMRSRFDLDQQARSQEIMAAVNRETTTLPAVDQSVASPPKWKVKRTNTWLTKKVARLDSSKSMHLAELREKTKANQTLTKQQSETNLKVSCLESSLGVLSRQHAADMKTIDKVRQANRELSIALKNEKESSSKAIQKIMFDSEAMIQDMNKKLAVAKARQVDLESAAKARQTELERESVAAISEARAQRREAVKREQRRSAKAIQRARRQSSRRLSIGKIVVRLTLKSTYQLSHPFAFCS